MEVDPVFCWPPQISEETCDCLSPVDEWYSKTLPNTREQKSSVHGFQDRFYQQTINKDKTFQNLNAFGHFFFIQVSVIASVLHIL